MSRSNSLTPLSDHDYAAVEAAVMETSRGRWFLAEYARRNRAADTVTILGAMGHLERLVADERAGRDTARIRYELVGMAEAITSARAEIAALEPTDGAQTQAGAVTEALESVVRTTERATSEIMDAAEHIQEAAWTLREADAADAVICDELDRNATAIYAACSCQDITAQRTAKVVDVLRYLERRINAMIDAWSDPRADAAGAEPPTKAPAIEEAGLRNDDTHPAIRDDRDDARKAETCFHFAKSAPPHIHDDVAFAESRARGPAEPARLSRQSAAMIDAPDPRAPRNPFAAVDELDVAEKLRRFS